MSKIAVLNNYEIRDAFFRPEQMIPANAPPNALGAANKNAMPALPADASKPGRATNTQDSMNALGKRPHNTPVIAPPTFPKRRDNNATAPTTNRPQVASSAIHMKSSVLQMWPPVNARAAKKQQMTHTSHAHKAMKGRRLNEGMSSNCTVE